MTCILDETPGISMTRGDTAKFKFQRKDNNGDIITTRPDEIFFTVKSNPKNLEFVFQKTKDDMVFDLDGTIHFTITPDDTNQLDWKRSYYYDIEVIVSGVKTTISYGSFVLRPEVTWVENEGGNS